MGYEAILNRLRAAVKGRGLILLMGSGGVSFAHGKFSWGFVRSGEGEGEGGGFCFAQGKGGRGVGLCFAQGKGRGVGHSFVLFDVDDSV